MNTLDMARVLKTQYSLSELEERLDVTPEELEDGYLYYVEENFEKVMGVLLEDLHFI
jgi:hypothetical protein